MLATVGVVTLTKVKHRRELPFAALPTVFAVHQFIEGFVWLGLDGYLSRRVTYEAGEVFVLYAQGLLPLLMPLGVMRFEPTHARHRAMLPFVVLGAATSVYMLRALCELSLQISVRGNSIVYVNQGTNHTTLAAL